MADDFGIGPGTSQGILDLAAAGRLVTATVLLVNSPHRESARPRLARRRSVSSPGLARLPDA